MLRLFEFTHLRFVHASHYWDCLRRKTCLSGNVLFDYYCSCTERWWVVVGQRMSSRPVRLYMSASERGGAEPASIDHRPQRRSGFGSLLLRHVLYRREVGPTPFTSGVIYAMPADRPTGCSEDPLPKLHAIYTTPPLFLLGMRT